MKFGKDRQDVGRGRHTSTPLRQKQGSKCRQQHLNRRKEDETVTNVDECHQRYSNTERLPHILGHYTKKVI
jgi:hypothetical protein